MNCARWYIFQTLNLKEHYVFRNVFFIVVVVVAAAAVVSHPGSVRPPAEESLVSRSCVDIAI